MKNKFINSSLIVNLYRDKSLKSSLDTQLIYGENFEIIKKYLRWKKIKISNDGYVGFIKDNKFYKPIKPNFKVTKLKAQLFLRPNKRYGIKKFLTYGSKIKIIEKLGQFSRFKNYWIKNSDIKTIDFKSKDIFKNIKIFKGVKYLWGGKSYKGVDCSALVQLLMNFNNNYCPRDSKDQEKYFKNKIKIKNIKKNDLLFWKGHVAIALSKKKLIHAYGPMKSVVIMDIKKTVDRIYKTANLRITSIRRPS